MPLAILLIIVAVIVGIIIYSNSDTARKKRAEKMKREMDEFEKESEEKQNEIERLRKENDAWEKQQMAENNEREKQKLISKKRARAEEQVRKSAEGAKICAEKGHDFVQESGDEDITWEPGLYVKIDRFGHLWEVCTRCGKRHLTDKKIADVSLPEIPDDLSTDITWVTKGGDVRVGRCRIPLDVDNSYYLYATKNYDADTLRGDAYLRLKLQYDDNFKYIEEIEKTDDYPVTGYLSKSVEFENEAGKRVESNAIFNYIGFLDQEYDLLMKVRPGAHKLKLCVSVEDDREIKRELEQMRRDSERKRATEEEEKRAAERERRDAYWERRKAQWDADEAARREQSKAHQRYLDAKRNYDHIANLYRQCIATGDQNGALIYKQSMDEAYAEMLNSGWSD